MTLLKLLLNLSHALSLYMSCQLRGGKKFNTINNQKIETNMKLFDLH